MERFAVARPCGWEDGYLTGYMLWFFVRGKKGAVQLMVVGTYRIAAGKIEYFSEYPGTAIAYPYPADLGYHSPEPLYEGQDLQVDDCDIIGGTCYYEGSGTAAREPFRALGEGLDALWTFLEGYYVKTFGGD